jgi:serine/threonine protein kinase
MPLTSGTRLGHYEIVGPLGAGGMGEVYRARDTKLIRDVAVKALPEAFADDRERLSRFTIRPRQRLARGVGASLSFRREHPQTEANRPHARRLRRCLR